MTKNAKRTRLVSSLAVVCVVLVSAGLLFACSPQASTSGNESSSSKTEEQGSTESTTTSVAIDESLINVSAPTTVPEADSFGVIEADSWADQYPNEYNSFLQTVMDTPLEIADIDDATGEELVAGWDLLTDADKVTSKVSYLDTNPEIKVLGLGYGYAKYYTEPAGHAYSLWTVENNGRIGEKTKITCFACKTPQYNADEATLGESHFARAFSEGVDTYTEGISCANCHVNEDPTTLEVNRAQWIEAMGDDADTVPMEAQVCGQCHCDYSMSPVNGEPTSPYTGGLESMTPEAALAFYDDNNYVDWTYESTGAQMIAVRHAEFEFNYASGGSPMVNMGYNCADCHMSTATDDEGNLYSNHDLRSPLDDEELLAKCNTCHTDLASEIKEIQDETSAREKTVGERCETFVANFEAAIEAGTLTDDQISELQYVQRAACFYWNLESAENSEGAHNPDLSTSILDSADEWLDKGDEILGVSSEA